jgi:hypothetical protein
MVITFLANWGFSWLAFWAVGAGMSWLIVDPIERAQVMSFCLLMMLVALVFLLSVAAASLLVPSGC